LYFLPLPHGHGSFRPIFLSTFIGCFGLGAWLGIGLCAPAVVGVPPEN
jgi:hypothetical protein